MQRSSHLIRSSPAVHRQGFRGPKSIRFADDHQMFSIKAATPRPAPPIGKRAPANFSPHGPTRRWPSSLLLAGCRSSESWGS